MPGEPNPNPTVYWIGGCFFNALPIDFRRMEWRERLLETPVDDNDPPAGGVS